MASNSQKRICSAILFSLTLSPLSGLVIDGTPAMADTMKSSVHSTTTTHTPVHHYHILSSIIHGVASFAERFTHQTIKPTTSTHTLSVPLTLTSTTTNTPAVWQPKTISVTPLAENQPFVGIPTSFPKHSYWEGIKYDIADIASSLPGPIAAFAKKIGLTPMDALPAGSKPNWSGMDVTNYSGPIPTQTGVPMEVVHLDPHLMTSDAGQGYRFMYSTSDVNGKNAVSTGEILLPKGPAPAGGWKTIDWAHGTVGVDDSSTGSATVRYDAPYMNQFLQKGYAVVSTDYVGAGTPGTEAYLAGKPAADNVNDAMIAASKIQGLNLGKDFIIDGRSQGGGSALAAANDAENRIKGTNLQFKGAIANAPAPGVGALAPLMGTPLMNVIAKASSIAGLHALLTLDGVKQYHGDGFDMDKMLTPYGQQIFHQVETEDADSVEKIASGVDFTKLFNSSTLSPAFRKAAEVENYSTKNIDKPTLVAQGFLDDQVYAPLTMIQNFQSNLQGQKHIDYKYYPLLSHYSIMWPGTRSGDDQAKFLNQLMGGPGTPATTTQTTTSNVITPPTVDLLH